MLWIDFHSKQSIWLKSKCYHYDEYWYFVVLSMLLKVCVSFNDFFSYRYRILFIYSFSVFSFSPLHYFVDLNYVILGARECTGSSKAHLTRCDMYYKCTVMPSGNVVWVPNNCPNGLVYDTAFRNCVIPGEQNRKKEKIISIWYLCDWLN